MKKVHFAYTVFDTAGYPKPSNGIPAWRDCPTSSIKWPSPIHAPYSITYNILNRLRQNFETKLYDIAEHTIAELDTNDIFLGHLYPKSGSFGGRSIEADLETVGWRTLERYRKGKTCVLQPFVYCPEIVEMKWLEPAFMELCDCFIAICGEYWERTWFNSPLSKANRKFLRINMCIDPQGYPWVRKSFRPKGKRRFLYIGHNRPYKNTAQLEAIAQRYPGFEGGCIGTLKGWHSISDQHIPLTPQIMAQLAEHFDVFLSTSVADAQATTILEQMSAGFPIACTPQSGYERPTIIKLDPINTDYNCSQIEFIQNMEDEQLMSLATQNRRLVDTEYSWNSEVNKVMTFVDEMFSDSSKQ